MLPELAPIAFIAAFSLLLPLPWHWRARNVATLSITGWLFILNMIYAVDAVIWAGNVELVAAVWCDITTKIIVGANFALPAACLCICIHLEQVASFRSARSSVDDKRRRQIFEIFMCIGLPIIFMALHYVVQGHRFDIIEDYGCRPTTYFSIPSIFIVWLLPILMAIGALVFSGKFCLALRHFMMRRLTFASHLNSSNSALTTSRYIRLMAMSAVQMFWSLTTASYALWFTTISVPIRPWNSWAQVHSDFLRVDTFPAILVSPIVQRAFYVLWWLPPASTFLFVAFFAFGKDAMDEYKRCFKWFLTRILRLSHSPKGFVKFSSSKTNQSLPISSPTLVSSSNMGVSKAPFSPSSSITKFKSSYDNASETEMSHYLSGSTFIYKEAKALGSISDFSTPPTPSTAVPPYSDVIDIRPELPPTPLPLTPPPTSYPRTRGHVPASQTSLPTSPRPFTYPSNDPSHHAIASMALTKP